MAALTSSDGVPPVADGTKKPVGRHDVHRKRMARLGWMFSAPALIFIGLVTIFPIVFSILMSFQHMNVTGSGYSFDGFTFSNYSLIFKSSLWRYALLFTIGYTIVTVFVELVLGTLIALVLERLVRGRGWMMALLLIPWSLVTVINAQLWSYIYDPVYGIADSIFHALGMGNPTLLQGQWSSIIALCVADVWKTTPFVSIIVLAGLVMVPDDVYEAASVDGARGWTTFWKITLPLVRPTIAIAVLFRILQAFGIFDLPFVLTQGGPGHQTTSLAILAYDVMFKIGNWGPGAAIATTTAVLVLLGCLAFLQVFKSQAGSEEQF